MQTVLISIPIEDFESKIQAAVESAVKNALAEREPIKYYSLKEAAKRTGKAVSTLYTHHCQGKLRAFKSGRQLRFSEEQLVAYLEGRPPKDE